MSQNGWRGDPAAILCCNELMMNIGRLRQAGKFSTRPVKVKISFTEGQCGRSGIVGVLLEINQHSQVLE